MTRPFTATDSAALVAGGWPVGDGTEPERPARAPEMWTRLKVARKRAV